MTKNIQFVILSDSEGSGCFLITILFQRTPLERLGRDLYKDLFVKRERDDLLTRVKLVLSLAKKRIGVFLYPARIRPPSVTPGRGLKLSASRIILEVFNA